jgi:GNAT superfamily N-acetyltransferase
VTESIDLRPATVADVEVCLGIQRAAVLVGYVHIFDQSTHPFPDEAIREEWVVRLGGPSVITIGSVDGVPSGVIGARDDRVEALFVVPSQWGTGLAGQLHDHAVGLIAAAGFEAAVLDVLVDNRRARQFYERRGWLAASEPVPSPWDPFPLMLSYRLAISAADRR